jgi:hypothetical protein
LLDVVLPAMVVLELLSGVEGLLSDAGGPPIAVVPVEGVVLPTLPGVVGPANAVDVLLPGVVPTLFVPATLPGAADVPAEPIVVLPDEPEPIVLEPMDCWLVPFPQGAASGAPELVWASAPPAANASATTLRRCANDFMADLL